MLRVVRATRPLSSCSLTSPSPSRVVCRRSIANETYDGVVLGIYENGELTPHGTLLDGLSKGLLKRQWGLTKKKGKTGDSVVLLESIPNYPRIVLVGLGKQDGESVGSNMRKGASLGVTTLRDNGASHVGVDTSFGNLQATAEGTYMALYKYDKGIKTSNKEEATPKIEVGPFPLDEHTNMEMWKKGRIIAQAQNMSKQLGDTPSNLMTPKIFVSKVEQMFANLENKDKFKVIIRDENWIQEKNMGLLYGVGKGSAEPPRLLEIHYRNSAEPTQLPLIFVGKGVCFDSGGYSIKSAQGMVHMKGDMLGAASVVCALHAIAQLNLPTNVSIIVPLAENMLSSNSVKPGDVLTGMNGKTVEITNTDAEGRLILADALCYAQQFKPHTLIDVATLTGAISVALGGFGIGAFTPENELFNELESAANETNERFWRMPLYPQFKKQLESQVADLVNSTGKPGGASSAAMFLKEFIHMNRWMHLDIAGVMTEGNGMSGKPVRTLVQLAERYVASPPVHTIGEISRGGPFFIAMLKYLRSWAPFIQTNRHSLFAMPQELSIQGKKVPLTHADSIKPEVVDQIVSSYVPFKEWVQKMSEKQVASILTVSAVNIQSVDFFGPKVGFIKFRADVLNQDGKFVPGITFMRGGSVSILVILKSEQDGKEHTLLTIQPRVPAGTATFPEIPAGMLDGEGVFVGVAAKELKEETGLEIAADQLVCLTDLVYGDKWPGMYPSPGGCDEFIKLYLYRKKVPQKFIDDLEGKLSGLIEEGETITLRAIPLSDLSKTCPDAKSLSSLCLYKELLANKTLPSDF